ncbi:hypothetical protein EPO04_01440 [Patescibacteria group bacterium]|nr:MAG: hypothetical protein EPO04_01440 [Patescibacteria group bacterium]
MAQTEISTQHKILEVVEAIQLRLGSVEGRLDSIEGRMGSIEGRMETFATKDDLRDEIKQVEAYVDHVADKIFQRLDITELNIRTDMSAMITKAVGEVRINTNYELGRLESLIMSVRDELKADIAATRPLTQA